VATAEEARSTFHTLRALSERLRAPAPPPARVGADPATASATGLGPALSMGMSDDYPVAIEEGATLVRVGRALFGERPHAHVDGLAHAHARVVAPAPAADRA
jgi:uncharacterized pyridoxal phosphate-containing UPF0001 family protein